MSTTEPGLREQTSLRTTFRVVGSVLLVVALVLLGLGLADFFSSMGSDSMGMPSRFWMAFVGILLLLVPAAWCLRAGFLGVGLRYVACSRCGTRNDVGAGFCDHGGHPLAG